MSKRVPYELNVKKGGIACLGRDPGADEVRQGKPFVGRSGRLLMDALAERGLRRKDVNLLNVCLAEGTRVLTADLQWIPIEQVEIGQKLFAFDEHGGTRGGRADEGPQQIRRWRIAEVTDKRSQEKECFEVKTRHGRLLATKDHRVLTMYAKSGGSTSWTSVNRLYYASENARSSLAYLFGPEERTKEDWYLQGLFDGEGCLSWTKITRKLKKDVGLRVSFTQRLNKVLEVGKEMLSRKNYDFSEYVDDREDKPNCAPTARISIAGHRAKTLRFLSVVRGRLLNTFLRYMEERTPPVARFRPSRVEGKESVGVRRVYDLTTTTGTFIAEGFAVHNCRFRPPGNNFNAHPRHQLEDEIQHLRKTLQELKPSVVVALGNEAAWAVCEDWPDTKIKDSNGRALWIHTGDIFGASQIMQRRGYVFDSPWFDAPVIAAIHPAAASRQWKPLRALISMDIARAKKIHREGFERPTREVHIVSESRAASKMSKL